MAQTTLGRGMRRLREAVIPARSAAMLKVLAKNMRKMTIYSSQRGKRSFMLPAKPFLVAMPIRAHIS